MKAVFEVANRIGHARECDCERERRIGGVVTVCENFYNFFFFFENPYNLK